MRRSIKEKAAGFILAGLMILELPMGVCAENISDEAETDPDPVAEISIQAAPVDLESPEYSLRLRDTDVYVYTGKEITPAFDIYRKNEDGEEEKLELQRDVDYRVEYKNNTDISAGRPEEEKPVVIVTGIQKEDGSGYAGVLKGYFEIGAPVVSEFSGGDTDDGSDEKKNADIRQITETPIGTCAISLSADSFVYDGTEKKPAVTVKNGQDILTENTDYTLTYQNNVNIGTATVTIAGKEGYTGEVKKNYTIVLGSTGLQSSTSYSAIKVTWGKIAGAGGYELYRSTKATSGFKRIGNASAGTVSYSDKKTTFNKTYYYRLRAYCTAGGQTVYGAWTPVKAQKKTLAPPVIKKTSSAKKSIKIKWGKVSGASGYAVYRSTSLNGKYKKIATTKKKTSVTYTNKKLSRGRTYYYKVRAYRTVRKKKYYGGASAAKAAKTKGKAAAASGAPIKTAQGTWRYVNGYKLFYNTQGQLVTDVSGIIGKQSSYVIKVNKKKNCVTVYAKDGKKGYIIPVKAFPCSAGKATPITTAKTQARYRWHELNGKCYGQWCTRIKQGYLFHSVMYGRPKNNHLSVANYNKLGTTASHGCIRLRAGDAKWIYNNCKLKTKVVIYNSSSPGPLGKPQAAKLPKWHKWDPTDPTASYLCRQRGCH